jgi:hypothetical protein
MTFVCKMYSPMTKATSRKPEYLLSRSLDKKLGFDIAGISETLIRVSVIKNSHDNGRLICSIVFHSAPCRRVKKATAQ